MTRRNLLASTALGIAAAQARLPRPAPAFSFTDAQGQAVRLADYRGKVVALYFLQPT
jgi:cytochrome oxidase Cu insertion factor (SCO1/SenC/PrrC family)